MKTAVFGATGKTGRLVVDEIRARGWTCSVLVRNRAKLTRADGLTVVEGDACSLSHVRQTITGAGVVFSCLAMSNIFVPATDHSDAVTTISQAMHDEGVRRVIAVASAGVLDHSAGGYRNQEGLPDILKHIEAENVRNFEVLRASGLEWTLMCPVYLKEDIPRGRGHTALEDLPPGSDETGYADLAQTMVALVDNPETFRKRVGIVSVREETLA